MTSTRTRHPRGYRSEWSWQYAQELENQHMFLRPPGGAAGAKEGKLTVRGFKTSAPKNPGVLYYVQTRIPTQQGERESWWPIRLAATPDVAETTLAAGINKLAQQPGGLNLQSAAQLYGLPPTTTAQGLAQHLLRNAIVYSPAMLDEARRRTDTTGRLQEAYALFVRESDEAPASAGGLVENPLGNLAQLIVVPSAEEGQTKKRSRRARSVVTKKGQPAVPGNAKRVIGRGQPAAYKLAAIHDTMLNPTLADMYFTVDPKTYKLRAGPRKSTWGAVTTAGTGEVFLNGLKLTAKSWADYVTALRNAVDEANGDPRDWVKRLALVLETYRQQANQVAPGAAQAVLQRGIAAPASLQALGLPGTAGAAAAVGPATTVGQDPITAMFMPAPALGGVHAPGAPAVTLPPSPRSHASFTASAAGLGQVAQAIASAGPGSVVPPIVAGVPTTPVRPSQATAFSPGSGAVMGQIFQG